MSFRRLDEEKSPRNKIKISNSLQIFIRYAEKIFVLIFLSGKKRENLLNKIVFKFGVRMKYESSEYVTPDGKSIRSLSFHKSFVHLRQKKKVGSFSLLFLPPFILCQTFARLV